MLFFLRKNVITHSSSANNILQTLNSLISIHKLFFSSKLTIVTVLLSLHRSRSKAWSLATFFSSFSVAPCFWQMTSYTPLTPWHTYFTVHYMLISLSITTNCYFRISEHTATLQKLFWRSFEIFSEQLPPIVHSLGSSCLSYLLFFRYVSQYLPAFNFICNSVA